MSILFGATVFFDRPEDFALVGKVSQNFPAVRYVEFRGERPFLFPENISSEMLDSFKGILKNTGLKSTVHTTTYDINLATLNPWIKDANITCYKKYIDIAAHLESEVIAIHGGLLYKEFAGGVRKDEFITLSREHLFETLKELGDYGQSRGVKVALENSQPEHDLALVRDAQTHIEILQALNHPNVGALFDVAHAFLCKLNIESYLSRIRPHLYEIHIHNNFGQKDEHLGLPHGKIDYVKLLRHPAFEGIPVIMEIRSYEEVVKTLEWLQTQGFLDP